MTLLLALFFIALGITFWGLRLIPAQPPHVGLVTIFGQRRPRVKREGWRFFMPPFYSFIPIKTEKINHDWEFPHIRCRASIPPKGTPRGIPTAGGAITATISITYQPDYPHPDRLIEFIDSGSQEGVDVILHGIIEEVLRQLGESHSWEEMTFAQKDLVDEIFFRTTGERPADETERQAMHKNANQNGIPDIRGLGIIVRRINVGEIKEEGRLAEVAELRAREIQERSGEVFETETEVQQAQTIFEAYKNAGTPKSFEDCLLEVRRRKVIREGRGTTREIIIPGLEEAIEALLRRKK